MPLHYPGYNYCGPGTKNFKRKPRNNIDKACRIHDRSYKSNSDYYRWNNADIIFLRNLKKYRHEDPVAADIMISIFEAKRQANKVLGSGYVSQSSNLRKKRITANGDDYFDVKRKRSNPPEEVDGFGSDLQRDTDLSRTDETKDNREDPNMPRIGKKRTRRTKRRRSSKRNYASRKYRRGSKSSKRLNVKIARILNPPITYENLQRDCILNTTENMNYYSVFFDPTYIVTDHSAAAPGLCAPFGFFGGLAAKAQAIQVATGVTVGTTDIGQKFWILRPKMTVRMTNYTSGVLFFKVFYLKCIDHTNQCLNLLNDTIEGNANYYPNTTVSSGGGASTYGILAGPTTSGTQESMFLMNKMTSIRECQNFNKSWKVFKTKSFKLEPNNNHSVSLKRKTEMFDPISYHYNGTVFNYRPGDVKIVFRVDPTITGTTVAAPPTTTTHDFISYGPVKVPYETYVTGQVARRTTIQTRRYQLANFTSGLNTTMLQLNPAIIGEPIQTGGADQAMTT